MGWFSPVKGSYPSLAQVDKTLPIAGTVDTVERGMIVALGAGTGADEANGVWELPKAGSKLLYVALTDATDPTAGFAGTSFTPNPTASHPARPAITAIDLAQDGEFETSVFDKSKTYNVGAALYANTDGFLTTESSGSTGVVGYVTAAKKERWVNNAVAVPEGEDRRLAYRTGAALEVIRFKTAV